MSLKCFGTDQVFSDINLDYEFLSNLESLSIEFSKIENFNLSRLLNLKYLEFIGTKQLKNKTKMISLVPETFASLEALEEMHLYNLQLCNSDLQGVFTYLKQLRVLDLSKNKIENINVETFKGLENLTNLDISGNQVDNVTAHDFVKVFPKLNELVLSSGDSSEKSKEIFSAYFQSLFKKVTFV